MIFNIKKDVYGLHVKVKVWNRNLHLRLHRNYNTAETSGIRNNTEDGKRIPFFDFDNHLLEHLIPELRYLQEKHRLSDFYVLKSSQKPHSYHVICLDKLDYEEWTKILNESTCDKYYKTMPITTDYKTWVLRSFPKLDSIAPKLIQVIKSKYQSRKKSKPHYLFLKYHYGVETKVKNLDNLSKIYTTYYDTLNYVKKPKTIKQP